MKPVSRFAFAVIMLFFTGPLLAQQQTVPPAKTQTQPAQPQTKQQQQQPAKQQTPPLQQQQPAKQQQTLPLQQQQAPAAGTVTNTSGAIPGNAQQQPPSAQPTLDYFINHALQSDPNIRQNANQQQFYALQAQLINAQNRAPQVNFTSDYLFAPFFANDGKPIAITSNPAPDAFGYDVGQTNGGMYATQLGVTYNLINKKTVKALLDQNNVQASVNSNAKGQLEHDLRKAITDQYIQLYQIQQQEFYLGQIIQEIKDRHAAVEALVKRGLLQQSDYLLLEIELNTRENDLAQAKITEVNAYGALKNVAVVADTGMVKLAEPDIRITPNPNAFYYREKFKLDSLNLIMAQNVLNVKYLPTLTFSGNGGMLASDFTNIPHNVGLEASLHFSIPIYDGHQRKIVEAQNKITMQNIAYARDNFTVQQKNYLQSLNRQIDLTNLSTVKIQQLIDKQELLLRLDREKLQGGQLSIIEYVKSLQDYATARQSYAQAKTQLMLLINQYNYYNW
jgi:outer membrane protein TolC